MSKKTARKKGWKAVHNSEQINQKTRLALSLLAIIFGLLVVGNTIRLFKTIFTPWQSSSSKRNYLWKGDFNFNVVVIAKKISLLSFSPKNQKVIVFEIPVNSYLEVPKGFGSWQLASIAPFGGDELLRQTLENVLGLPIDGYLDINAKNADQDTLALVDQFRKDPFIVFKLLSSVTTNLAPFELINLKLGLSSVRFDKIKQIDLEKSVVFEKAKLADGTEVYNPDLTRLDSTVAEAADPLIQSEHKTIAVFNSTPHVGLAQKASRLITNLGGNVIITTNGQGKLNKTKVIGEKSRTLHRLEQIFGSNDTIVPNTEDLVSSRAQINIFLGEDYFGR